MDNEKNNIISENEMTNGLEINQKEKDSNFENSEQETVATSVVIPMDKIIDANSEIPEDLEMNSEEVEMIFKQQKAEVKLIGPNDHIPDDLKEFFRNNYPVFIGGSGIPKELSSMGDGFEKERLVTEDEINSLSRETLLYLASFKRPDFILKKFISGSINFQQK